MNGRVIQEREFNDLLLDSVDEAFTDVLGMKFTDRFFTLLEAELQITKTAIPNRLDRFTSVLPTVFGSRAALVIGRAIAKRLYARLEIQFVEKEGYTLLDYGIEAKSTMNKQGRIE
jgi:hypothetical protein